MFQRALLFEKDKIDARKTGLEYERRELAVLAILDETTELRWQQIRCQLILQLRATLGLKIDEETFCDLLVDYKLLEEHVIDLAALHGDWLRDMLVERLGLAEWRVIEGGELGPA